MLTEKELGDLEIWAGCDLNQRAGDLVQRAVDEIRALRQEVDGLRAKRKGPEETPEPLCWCGQPLDECERL